MSRIDGSVDRNGKGFKSPVNTLNRRLKTAGRVDGLIQSPVNRCMSNNDEEEKIDHGHASKAMRCTTTAFQENYYDNTFQTIKRKQAGLFASAGYKFNGWPDFLLAEQDLRISCRARM